jgi:glycerate 2-kinase
MLPEHFLTASLRSHPRGQAVMRILSAAIRAVEPANLHMPSLKAALENCKGDIFLLGLGKVAPAMTLPLAESLADRSLHGLLIPKQAPAHTPAGFEVIPGGHPMPDQNSLKAGLRALELTLQLGQNDLLICLISGGGSALMTAPQPDLTLDDLQALTSILLTCGARIDEINTLRRHLDQVKGGGLAKAAAPAHVVGLILSDVVSSPLEAIASGPTAPDPTTKADAFRVIEKYGLGEKIPVAIFGVLENAPETPKPGDELFERVENVIVGSNALAARAALEQAQSEGFHPLFLGDTWQGEAREVAKILCARLKQEKSNRTPVCLVAGGETTVTLHGSGQGGRNQELALATVDELAGLENVMLVTLATDGEDGSTDAAGAVVTGETYSMGLAQNLSAVTFLKNNDSYSYFQHLNDLLKTGPTGTNVNDLTFLFAF